MVAHMLLSCVYSPKDTTVNSLYFSPYYSNAIYSFLLGSEMRIKSLYVMVSWNPKVPEYSVFIIFSPLWSYMWLKTFSPILDRTKTFDLSIHHIFLSVVMGFKRVSQGTGNSVTRAWKCMHWVSHMRLSCGANPHPIPIPCLVFLFVYLFFTEVQIFNHYVHKICNFSVGIYPLSMQWILIGLCLVWIPRTPASFFFQVLWAWKKMVYKEHTIFSPCSI